MLSDLNDDVIKALQSARRVAKDEMENVDDDDEEDEEEDKKVVVNDMKNCFGFDVRYLIT